MFWQKTNIPEFSEYYPLMESMSREQLKFYKKVEKSLSKEKYIEVEENISYIFVFIYKLLQKYCNKDFSTLYRKLIYLSEIYAENEKVAEYCLFWGHDCLLAENKLEVYLEKSEHKHPFGSWASKSDTRLNIQFHLNQQADIVDLVLLRNGRKNDLLLENEAIYRDSLYVANEKYITENGAWFPKLLNELGKNSCKYEHSLFNGAPISVSNNLELKMYTFYTAEKVINEIKNVSREAENLVRDKLELPRVGEGWISETKLYKFLSEYFSQTMVIQHGKPRWLGRQHFDIWFPNWSIAVEYHGKQHFEPVEFFGGEEAFKKNVERDKRKINLSRRHGVKLFVVTEKDDFNHIAIKIMKHVSKNHA
jgi:hypothetical protein